MKDKSVSEYLKTNTAAQHQHLEDLMGSADIFNGDFSIEQFQRLLSINHRAHLVLEPPLFSYLMPFAKELQLSERAKLAALEKDLQQVNALICKRQSELSKIPSLPYALGMMYVMEGATLGGSVIKKTLRKDAKFADFPFYYFSVYGENIGKMWASFIQILNERVEENQLTDCLEGAKDCYKLFVEATKGASLVQEF